MTKTLIAAAATVWLMGSTPVLAAPGLSAMQPGAASTDHLMLAQGGADRRDGRRGDGPRHDYRPGHRYERAPSHWRRYHSRPRDWHRRGCIIVGPLWFCP
jgi:hypothetical protein